MNTFARSLREAQEREFAKRLEALLIESLDDARLDIDISPEFWEDVKRRFLKRVARNKRNSRSA